MLFFTSGSVVGHHDCVFCILSTYTNFCILLTTLAFLPIIHLQELVHVVLLQPYSAQSLITGQDFIPRHCANISPHYAAKLCQSCLVIHVNQENCITYCSREEKSHHDNKSHSSGRSKTGVP